MEPPLEPPASEPGASGVEAPVALGGLQVPSGPAGILCALLPAASGFERFGTWPKPPRKLQVA